MCLIDRIVDPPLIPLVNINQNQLPCDIFAFIVRCGSFSEIHQGKVLWPFGHKGGLVSTELDLMAAAIFRSVGKHCFFKFPAIDFDGVFSYVEKTNGLHFLLQHFSGLEFGTGTGRTVPQNRIGAKLLHALGQMVGVIYIKIFQN